MNIYSMTLLKKILQFTKHTGFEQKLSLHTFIFNLSVLAGFFLSIVLALTVFDDGWVMLKAWNLYHKTYRNETSPKC